MAEVFPPTGNLARNILCFARLLRHAGLPVGTARVLDALRAVRIVGLSSQQDFYSCLFCLFVSRGEQRALFDQAFHLFWRNPRIMERMMSALLPRLDLNQPPQSDPLSRRLGEALPGNHDNRDRQRQDDERELDASFTFSSRELLRDKDFEQMSRAELDEAQRLIARMTLNLRRVATRRFVSASDGHRVDLRRNLRDSLRFPQSIALRQRKPSRRTPPLVVLCDISGSMARYSRMFLHFLHALGNQPLRLQAFVFATRLTNITRSLRHKDPDLALAEVTGAVKDWDGGTRIGTCLEEFNRRWSRRVLGQGAITLLISDGLDREGSADLAQQMERLAKSSRRLVWLNPLLRYEGFEPRARGVKAMLPHVDEFRSIHNLSSLEQLTRALSGL